MFQSIAGSNSSDIKLHNISAILLTLLRQRRVSRVALAQTLGVSTATITNLVNELIQQGVLIETGLVRGDGPAGVGRPQRALELVASARWSIGVHLDVGAVYTTLNNLRGQTIGARSFRHDINRPWQQVLDEIAASVEQVIQSSGVDRSRVVGVGVAASGLVDAARGINIYAPNLRWRDVPVGAVLSELLQLPVAVENNVRAMAFGEALLCTAPDIKALAFIYGRIGVGAGLVVNGQLYRGAAAGAGEIGHMIVLMQDGEQRIIHTLEDLVSEPAMLAAAAAICKQHPDSLMATMQTHEPLRLDHVFEAARLGDSAARAMLEERGYYLGIALANLVDIFNPELIVLGGIFSRDPQIFLPVVERTMREQSFAGLGQQVRLRISRYGADAGVVGAAALALDRFFYRPQNPINHTEQLVR